ncbi:MAG: Rne/Rng family ribonuclease [Deltaproteobacteria bacterium]|nr:Rne/Rng family ribonuclease [Deltaproteobacteria bacterium]
MKEIIINKTSQETRVGVMENGLVTDLYHERERERGVVGNIYKGRVVKVLPGMESAFVDIGLEKASFLYVDDVLSDPAVLDDYEDEEEGQLKKSKRFREKRQPITQLLKEGQEILVQVAKAPIGTKGARVTGHISLPGRNLVFMPTMDNVGVSRQITDDQERQRLKGIIQRLRPQNTGFILRTVAEGRDEEELKADVQFLVSLWEDIRHRYNTSKAPAEVYKDLSITYRIIRDLVSPDVKRLVLDDDAEYRGLKEFLKHHLPRYLSVLELYNRKEPVFDAFGIEEVIDRAMNHKVWLKSGGYLVINQTEALTAIDVNTGRFVGKGSHEETIFKTNLEAAEEAVYQLRLRNIGGIIIIDFIDMESHANRQKVYQALKDELKNDKARSKILQISEIGLVEMTRRRDRENLERQLTRPCPACDGTGRVKSLSTVCYELFRELDRLRPAKSSGPVVVHAHPDLVEFIERQEKNHLGRLEEKLGGTLSLRVQDTLHPEQYEIYEFS